MRVLRGWRLGCALAFLGLVAAGAWLGWQAWQVSKDLSAAVGAAERLQQAVSDDDQTVIDRELATLRDRISDASERTDGASWSILTKLPVYGDDARGVQLVSDVIQDLSEDGIEPIIGISEDLDGLVPTSGRVDVSTVDGLRVPVAQGMSAFQAAAARLDSEDPTKFVGALRQNYVELQERINDAARGLSSADTALEVLPGMLGSDQPEPRTYLLVVQNNAEVRATGGLPGAVAVVTAAGGQIQMGRQVAASGAFPRADQPALPLTDAERAIYGDELGTFFVDANFTPDFERTAALMKAHWEATFPETVDGVLSVDPVALAYLLEATGPVQAGGRTLTSDNAVAELLHEVYLRLEEPAEQDLFFQEAARAIFDKVTGGAQSPAQLLRGLARGVREGRIYVHSFEESEQRHLRPTAISGALVTDPEANAQVDFSLNDATGAKMSYFLERDLSVDATYCADGTQGLSATAHLLSNAPADAATLPAYVTGAGIHGTEPGSQLVQARIYGPAGGSISDVLLNAAPLEVESEIEDDRGRPVATLTLQLEPGQKVDLAWKMTTGPDQSGDVDVSVTPTVDSSSASSIVASAC